MLLNNDFQLLNLGAQLRQLCVGSLAARLAGGNGNMSRVRWVRRRLSEGVLFDAHKRSDGQQACNGETGCDDFVVCFHN